MTTTSTERLLTCLRGGIPDRVPISAYELVGWNPDAWENRDPSYRDLMNLIREQTDCLYMCDVPVSNRREGEIRRTVEREDQGEHHITRTVTHAAHGDLVKVTSFDDAVHTVWTLEHPVKNLTELEDYLRLPWEAGEPDFKALELAWLRLKGRNGLPLISVADPLCELAEAFEFGNFLVHAITETSAIVKALDILHERYRESLRKILAGPVQNAVFRICGPEYATRPYLPPELFRRFVTQYDGEYIRMIQESGAFARLHSHGKIAGVVDQIREMAPDALDPLEPPPDGDVELAQLKKVLGDRVCLMGGIELKHLEHAQEDQVDQLVRKTIETCKPAGRFVIMPTAAPINTPLSPATQRNYFRYIQTAIELGKY
jgi:hypothetical protein